KRRGVPVISAVQLLDWLDARNSSSFEELSFDGRSLRFGVRAATRANGLEAMLPASTHAGSLPRLTRDGAPGPFPARRGKGIPLRVLDAPSGAYVATYRSL